MNHPKKKTCRNYWLVFEPPSPCCYPIPRYLGSGILIANLLRILSPGPAQICRRGCFITILLELDGVAVKWIVLSPEVRPSYSYPQKSAQSAKRDDSQIPCKKTKQHVSSSCFFLWIPSFQGYPQFVLLFLAAMMMFPSETTEKQLVHLLLIRLWRLSIKKRLVQGLP